MNIVGIEDDSVIARGDYISFDGAKGGARDLRVVEMKGEIVVARMILPRRRETILRWLEDHLLWNSRLDRILISSARTAVVVAMLVLIGVYFLGRR